MTRKYLTVAAILLASSQSLAQVNAFKAYNGVLSDEQTIILNNLQEQESTLRYRVVQIDPVVFENEALQLNFFDDAVATVEFFDIGHTGIKYPSWTGRDLNELASAAFVINNNRISGHFTSVNGNYEIAPLVEDGIHMVFEHDNKKFEACGTENDQGIEYFREQNDPRQNVIPDNKSNTEERALDRNSANTQVNSSSRMAGTECFIRLILGYTSGAKINTNNTYGRTMNEHAALAVLDQNLGHANSLVEQRVELAYLYATTDLETSSTFTDINALRNTSDGKWDEIHTHRNNYDGDMCALITDGTYSGLCGRAYGFSYTDPANFFNLSEFNCIVGNYTMAHEFGHCQGLRHDNDPSLAPFAYAKGYNQGTFFRIIMAVCCSPMRVNYWSNPNVTSPFGGGAMGVLLANDNSFALDVGDAVVAAHRTTPATFTTSTTLGADETLNMVTTGDLTSTVDAPSGSVLVLKSQSRVLLQPGFHANQGSAGSISIIPLCSASYSRLTAEGMQEESQGSTNEKKTSLDIGVYPVPANEFVNISVNIKQDGLYLLKLFDIHGQEISTILDGQMLTQGQQNFQVDVSALSNGVYYLRCIGEKLNESISFIVN